jgi:hypothetical protein
MGDCFEARFSITKQALRGKLKQVAKYKSNTSGQCELVPHPTLPTQGEALVETRATTITTIGNGRSEPDDGSIAITTIIAEGETREISIEQ